MTISANTLVFIAKFFMVLFLNFLNLKECYWFDLSRHSVASGAMLDLILVEIFI
jgi:hypothetical protein